MRVHSVKCATLISRYFCSLLSSQYEKVVSISSHCLSPLLSQIRSHHAAAQTTPERQREDQKWSVHFCQRQQIIWLEEDRYWEWENKPRRRSGYV